MGSAMDRRFSYVLGLDLGVSSLGWAVLELDRDGVVPIAIRDSGVRIFEAGVEGDIEQGKDASRAAERRLKRQPRRHQWRRQWRHKKLFLALQRHGLLPASPDANSQSRKELFDSLDGELAKKHIPAGDHLAAQRLPYTLRANAARGPVDKHELGRALYHLGQRRGYLSNRQGDEDEEEAGKVRTGIGELAEAKGELTLGQYFAEKVDPIKQARFRRRYTSRDMYRAEFFAIRDAQKPAHPEISDEAWNQIQDAIFFQRPLKSQKHLIGRCELEKKRRRCPAALPIFQEFRILQTVNHLQVRFADGAERFLAQDEREKLVQTLSEQGEMSFKAAAKLIKLPKGASFTMAEYEDNLVGHRTNSKLVGIFGPKWYTFSAAEQTQIVSEIIHYRDEKKLAERGKRAWGLNEVAAKTLQRVRLESDFGRHSRQALEKLVPLMRKGMPYATARKEAYPESFQSHLPQPSLPPVKTWNRDIKSPAVLRALTELRKVVNALIAKYGKPSRIHVELARDLKNSRDRRKTIWKNNQDNRKRREKAKAAIHKELAGREASPRDIDKWLLADECGWHCPYTNNPITPRTLISDHPQFDIEHIYPRRYLDDSFSNKTLCDVNYNRNVKRDRLPFHSAGGETPAFAEMLQRVAAFQGPFRDEKLRRFKAHEFPKDFAQRQLNDTRYNSRLASDYVAVLFGGRIDPDQTQRVYTPTGTLTGMLRRVWGLNSVLGSEEKDREDHRHHAIDAVVVALIDQRTIQIAGDAAHDADRGESRSFIKQIERPWATFIQDVGTSIHAINVSHRATRTLAGPLHAETNYSRAISLRDGSKAFHVRKELHKLTEKEILGDKIVDPVVRAAVQAKYSELLAARPKAKPFQLWGDTSRRDDYPHLATRKGEKVPIFKARLRTDAKPRAIGKGVRERRVASGQDSNYASMVYAVLDKNGKEVRWEHEIITRLEAHERYAANHRLEGEKILIPNETETRRLKFSLMKNDCLLLQGPTGDDVLYRVQKLSQNEIQLCEHNVSTVTAETRSSWNRISSVDTLRKRDARKTSVSAMGDIAAE